MGDMYNRGGGALTPTSVTTTADVEIGGDLTVSGTTTTIETTNTVISDKLIELANGTSGTPSGDAPSYPISSLSLPTVQARVLILVSLLSVDQRATMLRSFGTKALIALSLVLPQLRVPVLVTCQSPMARLKPGRWTSAETLTLMGSQTSTR